MGCSPWGRYKSDTTEQLHFHFSLSRIGEGNGNPLQCSCLENPRDGGPGGLPSMASHRVRHNWSNLAAAAADSLLGRKTGRHVQRISKSSLSLHQGRMQRAYTLLPYNPLFKEFLFIFLWILYCSFHFLFFFNWRLITLQYYSGFFHTLTWISYGCTCVPHPEPPSHVLPHPIPQGHSSAPTLSTLSHASNPDWWSVSHMIIHMFQCYSLKSSHPQLLPQSPKVCSLHLCLFCCLTYRVIITIFINSIYVR